MCLNPIIISGYNNNLCRVGRYSDLTKHSSVNDFPIVYRKVSCGSCPECISLKQAYLTQRAQIMSMTHYAFFCTLTVKNEYLLNVQVGDSFYPAFDVTLFQNFVKRLRKYDVLHSDFKYLAVTEYGGTTHRPHMHVIFFVPKSSEYWSRFEQYQNASIRSRQLVQEASHLFYDVLHYWTVNVGSTRVPIYKPLVKFVSRFGRKNFDFHYVEPRLGSSGSASCVRYVTKYLLKYDTYITELQSNVKCVYDNPSVYASRWNILKPRVFISKNFGVSDSPDVISLVRSSFRYTFDHSTSEDCRYKYIDPETGKVVFMSPYLVKKYLKYDDCGVADKVVSLLSEDMDLYLSDVLDRDYNVRLNRCKKMLLRIKDKSNYDFYELE